MQDPIIFVLCVAILVCIVVEVVADVVGEEEGGSWVEGFAVFLVVLVVVGMSAMIEFQHERKFRELDVVKEERFDLSPLPLFVVCRLACLLFVCCCLFAPSRLLPSPSFFLPLPPSLPPSSSSLFLPIPPLPPPSSPKRGRHHQE